MSQVNLHEAKTQLSRLVDRAARGEEIIIARAGKPVAKLVPFDRDMTPRRPGSMRGLINVPDDFDNPMPPEWLKMFYEGDIEPSA
jgi:prevent-host-death family protein